MEQKAVLIGATGLIGSPPNWTQILEPFRGAGLAIPDGGAGAMDPLGRFLLEALVAKAESGDFHWERFQEARPRMRDERGRVLIVGDAAHHLLHRTVNAGMQAAKIRHHGGGAHTAEKAVFLQHYCPRARPSCRGRRRNTGRPTAENENLCLRDNFRLAGRFYNHCHVYDLARPTHIDQRPNRPRFNMSRK